MKAPKTNVNIQAKQNREWFLQNDPTYAKLFNIVNPVYQTAANMYDDAINSISINDEDLWGAGSWINDHKYDLSRTLRNSGPLDAAMDLLSFGYPMSIGSANNLTKVLKLTPATMISSKSATIKQDAYNTHMQLAKWAGINSDTQMMEYIRDATVLGVFNAYENKSGLEAYNKLRDNGFDFNKLTKAESKDLMTLYNNLYENSSDFKRIVNTEFLKLSDEDKMKFLESGIRGGFGTPAPKYLNTDLKQYQREIEPIKHYTNKELAELYNIDYNFDNIKAELDAAAQANVDYSEWVASVLANNEERDNTQNITDYLDSMRNIKSEAIQKGMADGARAAAELINNVNTIKNKVQSNYETAVNRFDAVNDALLQRANTEIEASKMYDKMAQALSSAGTSLYSNDINRYGQDLLANANFLSADENLRSTRLSQNQLMQATYNAAAAQNNIARQQAYDKLNYFKNTTLPAFNYDWTRALSNYMNAANGQNYGYVDLPAKITSMKNIGS